MNRHHHALTWPRLNPDDQVACHFCDALHPAPLINEGEAALCRNCGEVLYQNRPRSLSRAVAFSAAAIIFMIMAHSFPFLTMEAAGNRTQLGLVQSAKALAADGDTPLSLLTVLFTIVTPVILTCGLLYVTLPLHYGRILPGAFTLTRWIQRSEAWCMLEVFLLGFIVSLLKLGHVAEIQFEIGLWALVALVVCIAGAMSGIDQRELWDRLEVALDRANRRSPAKPETARQS